MNWDYFTYFIMGVFLFGIIALIFFLGDAPGKIARQRGHPQADAINVCSWIGLAAGGVGWVVALIWAYTGPLNVNLASASDAQSGEMETESVEEAKTD